MYVRDLMTKNPLTVVPATPVFDAQATMRRARIRHLLVVEHDRLVGIITDRDIRLNMPSPATTLSIWEVNYLLARLTVGEVMTSGVITVSPDRDAREAASIMVQHKIGALPVLDTWEIVGIVTETDLLSAYAAQTTAATV